MAEQKTRPDTGNVDEFLAQLDDPRKREDSYRLIELMREVTGEPPVLWGTMIGFGAYHYKYASGHEGDAFRIGFAPRKGEFSLYLLVAYAGASKEIEANMLSRLGKHRIGKSCLYVKKLADIDISVLRELIVAAFDHMRKTYP